MTDVEMRFWDKVRIGDGCWEWMASRISSGYGQFRVSTKSVDRGAHRMSWRLANDSDIPKGMCVCHRCDNKICVRPSHLFLGTTQENVADRVGKGRSGKRFGTDNASSKLSELEVVKIRRLHSEGNTQTDIAEMFGVTRTCVKKIIIREIWKDVP